MERSPPSATKHVLRTSVLKPTLVWQMHAMAANSHSTIEKDKKSLAKTLL
jgi:hypothetical protein